MSELPSRVRIREVGPRDGFQNEPEVIATDDKVALIELLTASGLERIELSGDCPSEPSGVRGCVGSPMGPKSCLGNPVPPSPDPGSGPWMLDLE